MSKGAVSGAKGSDQGGRPLRERLRSSFLRPVEDGDGARAATSGERPSPAELEASVKSANDKERFIGLLAAPFAAAIAILVVGALITNDPPARLGNGQLNSLHVSLSLYRDLGGVLIVLSILMLATAMWRKRLLLGIVTALYGLGIFNLHYWGFGVPFIMLSAWLLVRAYRVQRDLREATAQAAKGAARRPGAGGLLPRTPPNPSRRYTPPAAARKRPATPRSENDQRAG